MSWMLASAPMPGTVERTGHRAPSAIDRRDRTRLRQLDKRYRAKYGMSMTENLLRIQEIGVEAFVADEKPRWTCPECGSLLCVHLPHCGVCGRTWNPSEPADEGDS